MKIFSMMVVMLLVCVSFINNVQGEDMVIKDGSTVKFSYTLTVEGEVVDSSEGKDPLEFVQGQQMIIPGLEKELMGLKAGDKKTVVVAPEEGYGPVNQEAFIEFPKERLAEGLVPQVGMILELPSQDGRPIRGLIAELKDETIILDFNHPLAGKELTFAVEIVSIQ